MDLITTAQAADRLGVSLRTFHRLHAADEIQHVAKLPGKTGSYLFNPAAVDKLAELRAEAKVPAA